jgi:hypothetical protein
MKRASLLALQLDTYLLGQSTRVNAVSKSDLCLILEHFFSQGLQGAEMLLSMAVDQLQTATPNVIWHAKAILLKPAGVLIA